MTEYQRFCDFVREVGIPKTTHWELPKRIWQQLFTDLGFSITTLGAFAEQIGEYFFIFSTGVCRTSQHWVNGEIEGKEYGPRGVLMFIYDLRDGFEDLKAKKENVYHRQHGGKDGIEAIAWLHGFPLVESDIIPARFVRKYDTVETSVECKWDPNTDVFFDIPRLQDGWHEAYMLLPPYDDLCKIYRDGSLYIFN